jgi:uncharacterized protein (TIGR02265 family)
MDLDLAADAPFLEPRFDDFDPAAHLALTPSDATTKGMFFRALAEQASRSKSRGAVERWVGRNHLSFRDYPMRDFMAFSVEAARAIFPGTPLGEGLRRLGKTAYPTFAASMIGRVIVGVFGDDLERIFSVAPRAYDVAIAPTRVRVKALGPRHFRFGYEDAFAFVDSYQVGVIEGAILHHGSTPSVRVHAPSLASAIFDVRWA